jgi:hypothetical protein
MTSSVLWAVCAFSHSLLWWVAKPSVDPRCDSGWGPKTAHLAACVPWRAKLDLCLNGTKEIGQEPVGRGFYAGIMFDEGEAEHIEIEADGGAGAFKTGHSVGEE